MQGQRGRVVSVRHARPAAHTLRAVDRTAAVTRSSAPVQSINQRGRQRLTAAATQQPPHATGIRLPAAPPAADAQQRPPEAVPEPRQPLLRPPNSPAPQRAPVASWQPTRCHMPPRTPPHLKTASPRRKTPPQPLQLLLQSSTESEASLMAMPTTIDGRAAIQSSLVRAWGARGLRPHTAHRARDRRQLRRRLPAVLQPLLPCAQERGVAVRATTRSWRGRRPPHPWRSRTCCAR